jgi:hypothetical protein
VRTRARLRIRVRQSRRPAATMKEEPVISRHSSRDHAGTRGRKPRPNPVELLTPAQLAWANQEARRARAALRAEAALPPPSPPPERPIRRPPDEVARRARFAEAIARAEFGRFYRNGRNAPNGRDTKPAKPRSGGAADRGKPR